MTEQFEGTCIKYCKGACCRRFVLFNVTGDELVLFPQAKPVQTVNKVLDDAFQSEGSKKVSFVTNNNGMSVIGVVGSCPNLLPNGACGVYEERPNACRSLEVGDSGCRSARKESRMKPLGKVIG